MPRPSLEDKKSKERNNDQAISIQATELMKPLVAPAAAPEEGIFHEKIYDIFTSFRLMLPRFGCVKTDYHWWIQIGTDSGFHRLWLPSLA
jgi:hypothetical protein